MEDVKHDRVGKRAVTGPDQLKRLAVSALEALQAAPAKIRGFFHDPNLVHIRNAATV